MWRAAILVTHPMRDPECPFVLTPVCEREVQTVLEVQRDCRAQQEHGSEYGILQLAVVILLGCFVVGLLSCRGER